ncbi:MAG: hypothetical protein ACI81F_000001, partial [Thalassolituus oleivorans]
SLTAFYENDKLIRTGLAKFIQDGAKAQESE